MPRLRPALRLPGLVRRAFVMAMQHDALNLAQSAAYSAMVALFPALIVVAATTAVLPAMSGLRNQVGDFFDQVLPSTVYPLLTEYFAVSPSNPHTARTVVTAAVVSLTGASSVIATLMEGLRRAEDLPADCWTFTQRRLRAFLLVPLSLLPSLVATVLVVFGEILAEWLAMHMAAEVRVVFLALMLVVRWSLSLAGVVGLMALIYQVGTPQLYQAGTPQSASPGQRDPTQALRLKGWRRTLPGAVVATALWFITTLGFGWYVTRFANYGQVYGSLGAGIALLFWLYIVCLSVLFGAEFNAQMGLRRRVPPAVPPSARPNAAG